MNVSNFLLFFREVTDLRQAVNLILPMLPLYPTIGNGFNATGLAAQPTLQHVIQQSLLRKRPVAQTPTVPQPECPGQIRPVLSSRKLKSHSTLTLLSDVAFNILLSYFFHEIIGFVIITVLASVPCRWHHPIFPDINALKVS